MSTILEISNWHQLVRARSDHENLRIYVEDVSSDLLSGTKVSIVDYNTNFVYFCAFADVLDATIIPESGKMSNTALLEMINNFGFNVRYSEPTALPSKVIEILQAMYDLGYRYVYKYYNKITRGRPYQIYVSQVIKMNVSDPMISKSPAFVDDEWEWCLPFTTYPIEDLLETGNVNNGLPIQQ